MKFWGADQNLTHFLESSLAQPKLGEAQPIHRPMRKKNEGFLCATEFGLGFLVRRRYCSSNQNNKVENSLRSCQGLI